MHAVIEQQLVRNILLAVIALIALRCLIFRLLVMIYTTKTN